MVLLPYMEDFCPVSQLPHTKAPKTFYGVHLKNLGRSKQKLAVMLLRTHTSAEHDISYVVILISPCVTVPLFQPFSTFNNSVQTFHHPIFSRMKSPSGIYSPSRQSFLSILSVFFLKYVSTFDSYAHYNARINCCSK